MRELDIAIKAALEASQEILKIYQRDFSVCIKEDNTPVTQADIASNTIIFKNLSELNIPILSEEDESEIPRDLRELWIIDPLDGTKEFIAKNDEFSINIALVRDARPVLSLVYMPVFKKMYYAIKGEGAYLNGKRIYVSDKKSDITLLRSRNKISDRTKTICEDKKVKNIVKCGSAYKGCLIAEGLAEIYLSDGRTMEWDVCSTDLIVHEAGGIVRDLDGNLMKYNRENHLNEHGFYVASSKEVVLWR